MTTVYRIYQCYPPIWLLINTNIYMFRLSNVFLIWINCRKGGNEFIMGTWVPCHISRYCKQIITKSVLHDLLYHRNIIISHKRPKIPEIERISLQWRLWTHPLSRAFMWQKEYSLLQLFSLWPEMSQNCCKCCYLW